MKKDHLNFGRVAILGAAAFLVMATATPAAEPLPLEDWTVKTGSSQETLKAAFLGYNEDKVYLWTGGSIRAFEPTAFEGEMLSRIQAHLHAPQRPFTFDSDALTGRWSLSPEGNFTHRGGEFEKVDPGSFEVAGLVTGMTDAQVFKTLADAGYRIGPFVVTESQESKLGDKREDLPLEKRRYVSSILDAVLFRDSGGKPVSDPARIRDGEYEEMRTVRVKFIENFGAEPFHVVAHNIRHSVKSKVMNQEDVTAALLASAKAKYGKPMSTGGWSRPYGGVQSGSTSPESLSISSEVMVDNPGLETRLSWNLDLADEVKSKSTGPAKKLDF